MIDTINKAGDVLLEMYVDIIRACCVIGLIIGFVFGVLFPLIVIYWIVR